MSETNSNQTTVRGEEPELNDEALEQVAGGCQIDQSVNTYTVPKPIDY